MKEISSTGSWGGRRKGAGRHRKMDKLAVERTKVIRVSLKDYARVKNGNYDELMHILFDWRVALEDAKGGITSPRWQKMRQMFEQIEEVFGSDFRSWVDKDD